MFGATFKLPSGSDQPLVMPMPRGLSTTIAEVWGEVSESLVLCGEGIHRKKLTCGHVGKVLTVESKVKGQI